MRLFRDMLVCLGIGAASNIIVAWCLVLAHSPVAPRHEYYRSQRLEDPQLFVTRLAGYTIVEGYVPLFRCGLDDETSMLMPVYPASWWHPEDLQGIQLMTDKFAVAAGWPLPSLSASVTVTKGQWSTAGGWIVEPLKRQSAIRSAQGPGPVILPHRPIAVGTLVNSLVYATAAAIPMCCIQPMRRVLRAGRGQCVRCAYPRENHTICPECGTTHKPRMREPISQALPPA